MGHNARERRVLAQARAQRNLLTVSQLETLGVGADAVQHRVSSGRWRRVHRGVYTVAQAPLDRDTRQLAALLACGPHAVLSHRSAAALWGLIDDRPVLQITVPYGSGGRRAPSGAKLHRTRRLEPADLTARRGLPVTTVARTLVDLAAAVDREELERAVHEAEVLRLLDRATVEAAITRLPARAGVGALRAALGTAAPDPTNSEFVRRYLSLCRRHGLPHPQTTVYLDAGFPKRTEIDILYRAERLIIELDGEQTHLTRRRFHHDRRRDAALAARGYLTLRYTWHRVTREAPTVAAEVRAVLALRLA
jgi:hypothetical protein